MGLWIWLVGCAPGTVETAYGSDELHTAWYVVVPGDSDYDQALLLLSNSQIGCDASSLDFTPDVFGGDTGWDTGGSDSGLLSDRLNVSEQLSIALNRENSRIVLLELVRFGQEGWKGYYPLSGAQSGEVLDLANPRVAHADYYGVNEAIAVLDDGLLREYQVTDFDVARNIDAPGSVEITGTRGATLRGRFNLDPVDVSGRFRAKQCSVEYSDSVMAYLQSLLSLNL
ncbi:MAG: hypothetical protein VX899_10490 [Myxococcota bacterium]|nr:hypothetical protein [Myxococcota bacterium]